MIEHSRASQVNHRGSSQASNPSMRRTRQRLPGTPDLAAFRWIIVHQRNASTLARGTHRCGDAARPGTHNDHIELPIR